MLIYSIILIRTVQCKTGRVLVLRQFILVLLVPEPEGLR
jgi:hypothetical protein